MKARYFLSMFAVATVAFATPAPATAQPACWICLSVLGGNGWTCHTAWQGGYYECQDWYDEETDGWNCEEIGSGCSELAYVVPTPDGELIVARTPKAAPPRLALAVFDACTKAYRVPDSRVVALGAVLPSRIATEGLLKQAGGRGVPRNDLLGAPRHQLTIE